HAVVGADVDPVRPDEPAGAPRVYEPPLLVEDDQRVRPPTEDEHALARVHRDADHLGEGPAFRKAFPALHHLVLDSMTAAPHGLSLAVGMTVHLTRGSARVQASPFSGAGPRRPVALWSPAPALGYPPHDYRRRTVSLVSGPNWRIDQGGDMSHGSYMPSRRQV